MSFFRRFVLALVIVGANGSGAVPTAAQVTLPAILSDHMILQRDVPVKIWGRARPGDAVSATFGEFTAKSMTDTRGRWDFTLGPMPASARPRDLIITAGQNTTTVHDVLVGEVWLCSGQSNMEWPLRVTERAEEFTTRATNSAIRMFMIPHTAKTTPQVDAEGQWLVASPETAGQFSAVGYHFALQLANHLDVPVGLVNSSWGGSAIQAWIDRETLETLPAAAPFLNAYDQQQRARHHVDTAQSIGPQIDPSQWKPFELPGLIEDRGYRIDGTMWFRRTITIPEAWNHRELTMELGAIDDNDITYFNGHRIGATSHWQQPRVYTVPAEFVEPGPAVVAVFVEDTGGAGGFSGAEHQLTLHPTGSPSESMPLAGSWFFRVQSDRPAIAPNVRPANLFNGMIYPIRRFVMRGVIWYQGESNAIAPGGSEYKSLFPAMIRDWRAVFRSEDMPFYFVQLPNFANDEPNTIWRYPLVREAQLETLRTVPNTGMAITIDIGNPADIHPRNKYDVGLRLAQWALHDTYGLTDIVKSGPVPTDANFLVDGSIVMHFDCFGSTLTTRDGSSDVTGLEVAGPDGAFQGIPGTIQGDTIVIAKTDLKRPTFVRYAWRNNPTDANVVNALGIPASPFEFRR